MTSNEPKGLKDRIVEQLKSVDAMHGMVHAIGAGILLGLLIKGIDAYGRLHGWWQ